MFQAHVFGVTKEMFMSTMAFSDSDDSKKKKHLAKLS